MGAIEQDEGAIGTLVGDTITANTAPIGGGIDNESSSSIKYVASVIVALNTGVQGPNCYNFESRLVDGGYNLVGDTALSCGFSTGAHDLIGVNPQLKGLGAYGGPTLTEPPLPSSPVVGAGPMAPCQITTDQRGVPRPEPVGGACGIGAVEPAPPYVTSITPASGPAAGGTTVSLAGSGFTLATGVTCGRIPVRFRVVNDTRITLVTPPGNGTALVTVTNPDGKSVGGQFHYNP